MVKRTWAPTFAPIFERLELDQMRRRDQRRQALSPETSYREHPAFEDQSTHCSDPGLASRYRRGRSRTLRTEIRERGPARTVWAHGHKKSWVRLATVPTRLENVAATIEALFNVDSLAVKSANNG